jgi:hypothetical protein
MTYIQIKKKQSTKVIVITLKFIFNIFLQI